MSYSYCTITVPLIVTVSNLCDTICLLTVVVITPSHRSAGVVRMTTDINAETRNSTPPHVETT